MHLKVNCHTFPESVRHFLVRWSWWLYVHVFFQPFWSHFLLISNIFLFVFCTLIRRCSNVRTPWYVITWVVTHPWLRIGGITLTSILRSMWIFCKKYLSIYSHFMERWLTHLPIRLLPLSWLKFLIGIKWALPHFEPYDWPWKWTAMPILWMQSHWRKIENATALLEWGFFTYQPQKIRIMHPRSTINHAWQVIIHPKNNHYSTTNQRLAFHLLLEVFSLPIRLV